MKYDLVLLTQKDYFNPQHLTPYIQNVLLEDQLLTEALQEKGFKVTRAYWDDESFDWDNTRYAMFRATWDYFHRFNEFHTWLKKKSQQIQLINSYSIIQWNMNKKYLIELQQKGINIPPTLVIAPGTQATLSELVKQSGWDRVILKPAISGGARHTYLLDAHTAVQHEEIYQHLIQNEAMLLQEFQNQISTRGEVSFMVFGGKYSHAVLKKAKAGDFRVQDDHGGTVHPYQASIEEQNFVERVIALCPELPVYARVDVMWDNANQLCLSELELIEPELWFRADQNAAAAMARAFALKIHTNIDAA